MQHIIIDM